MSRSHFLTLTKFICLMFLLTSTLNTCLSAESSKLNSNKKGTTQLKKESDPIATFIDKPEVNERIFVRGKAENAKLGAVVITEDFTPVFLDGVQEWDSQVVGKSVVVTGVLRRKLLAPKATSNPNGEISQGVEDDSYVLENPSWFIDR